MKVIGLTGSFGCGKTTVAKMFEALGAKTIDADKIVTQLYKQGFVKKKLQKSFGEKIVSKKGIIERKKLAAIVFSDKTQLAKLNPIVHPLVFKEIKKKLSEYKRANKSFVTLYVPLLLESKTKQEFDFLVVVSCTKKIQLERLGKRGFSKKEALNRINAQLPLQKKIESADFVIKNNGALVSTQKQVKKVFVKISKL